MDNGNKISVIATFVLLVSTLVSLETVARDSPFTRKGTGPKYWIAYEYCWVNNVPIPEARWKANIDWMETSFKPYGYDMICNDGWIEGAQTVDANGYIVKYNDEWEHGFAYWAGYLAEKGMKMGVYYNPLWMTKAAFDRNVTVKGTSVKARDIAGPVSFNEPLYWVDVDKKGAKEWIQGYVKHFIDLGATFLRIDFLENYEKNYGTAKYRQALEWIKEAAGDRLFLSLVMPNCFDHGRNERIYGDMIRIDDDCFGGGWDFVSNRRRGQQKAIWPQYGNMFDGFLGFADIGGRGQLILDGDFMRMNTMADDRERMFKFSLMVMGGSALAIADQYDTVEEHAWVYQNKEMLELNDRGLVAKPLSYDPADRARSSVWAGQLPDGDWVIGFFNREETKQVRRIDFERDLGIVGGNVAEARDLWRHADLGSLSGGYSVELEPHECRVIRVKNPALKYEAEFASLIGGAEKQSACFRYSGTGYAGNLDQPDSGVLFAVEVPSNGTYTLRARYANASGKTAVAGLYVNDRKEGGRLIMPSSDDPNQWNVSELKIALESGVNFISIGKEAEAAGSFLLDCLQIVP